MISTWWLLTTHLKNMRFCQIGSIFPRVQGGNKKICELPPPSCFLYLPIPTKTNMTMKKTPVLNRRYIRSTPHPVTVTTRNIIFLVGNPYKPSFATVTGRGVVPRDTSSNGCCKKKSPVLVEFATSVEVNSQDQLTHPIWKWRTFFALQK